MWKIVQEGPVEELNKTEVTQPAMLTAGVAVYEILKSKISVEPVLFAGHSLGEYTALVCTGSLKFEDAVKLARSRLPGGESLTHCEECETVIPEARRKATPGVRLCISCQSALEEKETAFTGFNRRGSKDSQLR